MRTFEAATLEGIAAALLGAAGSPGAAAEQVAEMLVWSEQIGHSSHGLLRLPNYVDRIEKGLLVPAATPTIERETATTALIDGGWGFGQMSTLAGMDWAIEKARAVGTATVGVYHLNHVGRLGDFTEMGARAGLITLVWTGGAPTGVMGDTAPFGGRQPVWGTNPMAIAMPTGDQLFSIDFATSIIAHGKASAAAARGVELDADYLMDAAGKPTRDPRALTERGGAIRPFGEHKGYGLAFAIELLCGALIGGAAPEMKPGEVQNGLFILAIDPACFGSADGFQQAAAAIVDKVKASPPAEGFDEVLIPGEPEYRQSIRSRELGISVPDPVIDELTELGRKYGLSLNW
ncbi:Ldh family oxidoreductase [Actinomycetota bacterium]